MTAQTGAEPDQGLSQPQSERRRESHSLDRRYGAIGIPAVAAALRYAGATKNPAYAPVVPRPSERFSEAAA